MLLNIVDEINSISQYNCQLIGLLLPYTNFGTVIKRVRHSFDFLLCSLSVSNCRKTCIEKTSYKKKRVICVFVPFHF